MLKLNLGGGDKPLDGFITVDRKNGGEVYPLRTGKHVAEDGSALIAKGHEVEDSSVDEIYASHVLEHFSFRETLDVLKEWVRVLKPGGVIRIAVPDFDKAYACYANGIDPRAEMFIMGSHTDANDHHGAIFNEAKLRELMRICGLTGIRRWESENLDCAALPVSLNLMGVKREVPQELKGVVGIMSMPRLAFTDQATAMYNACHKLKIPLRIRQGVFWEATLTQAIESAIAEDKPEFLLTIDYDTIFTPDDVMELYRLMRDNPEADAIFAAQVGRDRDSVLLTIKGEDGQNQARVEAAKVLREELLRTTTGHFGLTMIRTASLARVEKPWFVGKPDPDGSWGEGRIDADIQFWLNAEKAGWNVYQANGVAVGHLQLMVSWPSTGLTPIHQYVTEYRNGGKPQGVLA